ncbi:beta-lactamase domain-containing protein 2-like [Glandiceps talaboti]
MSFLRSAALVAITAIVVTFLPVLLRKQLPVHVDGTVEPGFEEVARVFRNNHEQGLEAGSAFSAYYKGKKVVDLWGGYANVEAEDPWQQYTMSVVYSATKGVAAICIAVAVDRGLLDYNQKVAYYWPDFAQKGKENITLKQLVNHEAGVPVPSETPTIAMLQDLDWLGKVLAASELQWEPGTATGYHAINYGWLLTEVLRRADPKHRTIGQFLQEEIAKPFDIDFFIGLPKEEDYRVAKLVDNPYMFFQMFFIPYLRPMIFNMFTEPDGLLANVLKSGSELGPFERINTYAVRALESPASNGIGTARGLAKLYSILANGGTLEGEKLLSKKMVETLPKCDKSKGPDKVIKLEFGNLGRCTGFHYHFNAPEGLNMDRVVGHYGLGGQAGFFDYDNNLAFGYQATLLSVKGMGDAPRYQGLIKALYDSVKKIEKE